MTRFEKHIERQNWESLLGYPVFGACYVQRWSINLIQS